MNPRPAQGRWKAGLTRPGPAADRNVPVWGSFEDQERARRAAVPCPRSRRAAAPAPDGVRAADKPRDSSAASSSATSAMRSSRPLPPTRTPVLSHPGQPTRGIGDTVLLSSALANSPTHGPGRASRLPGRPPHRSVSDQFGRTVGGTRATLALTQGQQQPISRGLPPFPRFRSSLGTMAAGSARSDGLGGSLDPGNDAIYDVVCAITQDGRDVEVPPWLDTQ